MELFKSLTEKTKLFDVPFKHYELNEPLSARSNKSFSEF